VRAQRLTIERTARGRNRLRGFFPRRRSGRRRRL